MRRHETVKELITIQGEKLAIMTQDTGYEQNESSKEKLGSTKFCF